MVRIIRHHAPAGAFPLLISEIFIIGASFYFAAMLFQPDPSIYFLYEGGLVRALVVLASLLGALYFFDLYSDIEVPSRALLFQQLCQAVGVAMLAQSLMAYAFRDYILPHFIMLYGSIFALLALFLWRMLYSAVLLEAVGREQVLFVGCNPTAQQVAHEIATDPASAYEVSGCVDDDASSSPIASDAPLLGPLSSLRQIVKEKKPGRIVIGLPEERGWLCVQDLLELRFAGCRIEEASITYEDIFRRICSRDLTPGRVVFMREFTPAANALWFSHTLGRVMVALVLVILAPVLLGIALLLRLESRLPALIVLPRVGREGQVFNMFRFRDSRVLGSLYRRLRLAALPGLLNVLRGEMSLVGPRPASLDHARALSAQLPLFDYRHNVSPGMTGWAQINTSGERPVEAATELEYDLYYIKHMSPALNGYVLLNTFKNRVLRIAS